MVCRKWRDDGLDIRAARHARYSRVVAIVTLDIPDELSAALAAGRELSRSVFEALALEACRERKLSTAQLGRLLGFESRYELDGFLKAREVWLECGAEGLERGRNTQLQSRPLAHLLCHSGQRIRDERVWFHRDPRVSDLLPPQPICLITKEK